MVVAKELLALFLLCQGPHLAQAALPPRGEELTASYTYEAYRKNFRKGGHVNPQKETLFNQRLAEILKHNANPHRKYSKGVNEFTDVPSPPKGRSKPPSTELSKKHASDIDSDPRIQAYLAKSGGKLPETVDWRDAGIVSPVKNQGHCGSCWAFASTAVVESHVALATDKLYSLSPQQLVACAPNDDHCGGVGGCMGSIPELAYDYIIEAGGMAEEWSWPYFSYTGQTNGTCMDLDPSPNTNPIKAGITSYVKLSENNASSVMTALAAIGPLAVNVDASIWSSYESGIFDGCSYDDMEIDHVVVLVGYGTDESLGDYWLIRNSWSPSWGENGYIRLLRDPVDETPCGVDTNPQDGTGCDGDPTQYPCGQCGVVFDVSYPLGGFSV